MLFDFDGVIAETLSSHIAAWKYILDPQIDLTDDMIVRLNEGLPAYKIAQAIYHSHHFQLDEFSARCIARNKNAVFVKSRRAKVYAGVRDVIHFARKYFKIGLVTGTTRENVAHVLLPHQQRWFQTVITESDVARGKPHPDPYFLAMEYLQLNPSETVVVENAPVGIKAAKNAGIFCVALETTLSAEYLVEADLVCRTHGELFLFLQSLIN
ncbi:HAD-IA family hydrolase [candidate division KSB1 bacterium]|nr:HAD-IA family hydrolase [candidate division KSB1 bacterium]